MSLQPVVIIDNEQDRYFENLSAATDYAVTRARPDRPVGIEDEQGTRYVVIRRDPRYTITLSRTV